MEFLAAENPYSGLVDSIEVPPMKALVENSTLLHSFSTRKKFADPEEVAVAEYTFFINETYLFELVGLQLLGEMTSRLGSYDAIPALAEQSIDEARHVAAYKRLLGRLPVSFSNKKPEDLHQAFVASGSVEENAVTAFVVLESLAMGMFSARASAFSGTSTASLDRQILFEESRHQDNGLQILTDLVFDGRMTCDEVMDATRVATKNLGRLLSPAPLLQQFGIDGGHKEVSLFSSQGVVARQKKVTQRCLVHALRKLRERTNWRAAA